MENEYRQISLKNLSPLGSGKSGTVYRLDENKVLKVYQNGYGEYEILKEFVFASILDESGISVSEPREIVRAGIKYGIIYSLVEGRSLKDILYAEPEEFEDNVKLYTGEVRKIHDIILENDNGMSIRSQFFDNFLRIPAFSVFEKKLVLKKLSEIPERNSLLHMDPKPENLIISQDEKPVWIDFEGCGTGHPIFALQEIYCPEFISFLPGINEEDATGIKKIWDIFVEVYFSDKKERIPEIIRGIRLLANINYLYRHWIMSGVNTFYKRIASIMKAEILEEIKTEIDFDW